MPSLALACRLSAAQAPQSLPRRVRSILSKYQSTLLIPGVNGALRFGFQPGNYVESTGQTLSAADAAVGLVVDAARVPGPELVTTLSVSGVPIDGATAVNFYNVSVGDVVSGKYYEITATISGYSGTGDVGFSASVAQALNGVSRAIGNGVIKGIVQCVNTTKVQVFTRPATNTCTFSNISVRELTGTHAIQATDGYKPLNRRGLVNLLLSSHAANVSWTKAGSVTTPSATAINFPNKNEAFSQPLTISAPVGASATHAVILSGSGTIYIGVARAGSGTYEETKTKVTLSAEPTLFVVSHTIANTGQTGFIPYISRAADGTATSVTFGGAALFQGTVTAQQIIAAGGIPVTTTAAASSSLGPRYWQFDGTDDRLSLSAVPFQMSDDHWVVAGCRTADKVTGRAIASVSGTTQCRIAQILISNAGSPTLLWRDDAGVAVELVKSADVTNIPVVVSAVKRASLLVGRSDGSVFQTSALPSFGACTPISAGVGANTAISAAPHNGAIHGVIFGKGAISDSELLTLERWMATLQGRRI